MSRNEMTHINLWPAAALIAPLAHWTGTGYVAALFAVLLTLPLTLLPRPQIRGEGKLLRCLQWLWTTAVLAHLLPAGAEYWTGGSMAVPLTLLSLTALCGGKEKAKRTGNTLFWLIVPILFLVVILSVGGMEPEWLRPTRGRWSWELPVILFLPCLASCGTTERNCGIKTTGFACLAALESAVLIQGVLSSTVAMETSAPLYEVGRAIGGGGEIIVSVGLTLSWYALCSFLFESACAAVKGLGISEKRGRGITFLLGAGLLLIGLRIPGPVLLGGSILLWVAAPKPSEK